MSTPPPDMRASVERLLDDLCAEHGIPKPRLEWSSRMRVLLGKAYANRGLIRLSAWLDDQQADDTLRHELAHIADGPARRDPHGARWRAWAARLGAAPRATSPRPPANRPSDRGDRRYIGLECPACKARFVRARVLRGLYCRACGPSAGTLERAAKGDREQIVDWAARRNGR